MPVILRGVVKEEEDRRGGERMEEGLEKEEVCDGRGGAGGSCVAGGLRRIKY